MKQYEQPMLIDESVELEDVILVSKLKDENLGIGDDIDEIW